MNILTELEQLFILENAFVFKAEKKKTDFHITSSLKILLIRADTLHTVKSFCVSRNNKVP